MSNPTATSSCTTARQSLYPHASASSQSYSASTTTNTSSMQHHRQRQYTHLNAQLAQLNAHLADMENLLRMTAVQAEYSRGLGGWCGGLFMAASKILGEETSTAGAEGDHSVADPTSTTTTAGAGESQVR